MVDTWQFFIENCFVDWDWWTKSWASRMGKTQRSVGYLQSQGKESRAPASYGFLPNNTRLFSQFTLASWCERIPDHATYSEDIWSRTGLLFYIYIYSWYIGLTLSSILHVITCMIQKNTPYMMVVVEQKYVYIYMQHMLKSSTHTHTKKMPFLWSPVLSLWQVTRTTTTTQSTVWCMLYAF